MMLRQEFYDWIDRIDTQLSVFFSNKDARSHPLERAMEYTLLAGGKRIRALLTLATVADFELDITPALPFSLASELVHTYSLIHDDLPCMDDDDLRRGKPSNHIVFGEANAILAGDALQVEAFGIFVKAAHPSLQPQDRLHIMGDFCQAIGRHGMVAGQVMDLENKTTDLESLKLLHRRKTGALLSFCVRLGCYLASATPSAFTKLNRYADCVGLLFQVVDDLLDKEGDSTMIGKTLGKDALQNKATFPKFLGSQQTHHYADELLEQALSALEDLAFPMKRLQNIAHFIRNRSH